MADELYALTAADLAKLRRLLSVVESGIYPSLSRRPVNLLASSNTIVGILTDPISATTGLTTKPKVGTLNVYSFTSTGSEDTGADETVYSFAPQSATTDRWSVATRDTFTGKFILHTQFCS